MYMNMDFRAFDFYKKAIKTVKPSTCIFLVDQSGSMRGSPMEHAKNAVRIMLNGLTEACMFNVFGFGSTYNSIFPEPVYVTEERMGDAMNAVNSMNADMGGTEIYGMLEHVFERLPSQETFVYLLTDGEVWNIELVTNLIKEKKRTKPDLFMSCLGISESTNHDLLNGIAQFGGGIVDESDFVILDNVKTPVKGEDPHANINGGHT